MPRKPNSSDDPAELRRRAETRLRDQRKRKRSKAGASEFGPERQLHELEVHQIELELQNTELQKARNELEVTLEKFTDLYDFAPVGYFSVDESGEILEANLTSAVLLGIERSRLIHRRLPRLVAPESRPFFLAFLNTVFSGARDSVCEVLLSREKGGTFWASLRGTPAVSIEGAPRWCRVACADITDRKQAEGERARLAAIVESSEDAIVSKDLDGIIVSWNAGAERIFGYTAKEAIGRPVTLIIPRNRMDEEAGILEHIRRGERLQHYETVRRRKDGRLLDVVLTVSPVLDSYGQIIGASKIARDITERKRAEAAHRRNEVLTASNRKLEQEIIHRRKVEDALKQSQKHQHRLLQQSRLMQEQLRKLSHRILWAQEDERKRISRELHDVIAQTLTGINVHLAGLKIAASRNTKGLEQNIARTQRLVEQSVKIIHKFARELRPAALDDLGLIPALNAFMKHFQAGIGLRISLAAEPAAEQVHGDKRAVLFRVAQEALTNVARHARASRAVVTIQKLDRTVCMIITDNGKGFRQERVARRSLKQRLGLVGMRERVEMVKGSFSVQSTPGQGTTVRVQIPLAEARGGAGGLESRAGR